MENLKVVPLVPIREGVLACKNTKLPELFVGLSVRQSKEYVALMEQEPEFADGVIHPTQKTTIVIVDRFIEFLRFMDEKRFDKEA